MNQRSVLAVVPGSMGYLEGKLAPVFFRVCLFFFYFGGLGGVIVCFNLFSVVYFRYYASTSCICDFAMFKRTILDLECKSFKLVMPVTLMYFYYFDD